MALPKAYLTSVKNTSGIFNSIVGAQAPKKFTTRFLESLDYKANADRLYIGVLKGLGFLEDDGQPTQRYFEYLDQTRSAAIMAEAIREAYADLFQVNINAHKMTKSEVVNKLKTLSQGQYSESVLDKMGTTFTTLCGLADFDAELPPKVEETNDATNGDDEETGGDRGDVVGRSKLTVDGLVYNIQLILPESRDPKVYDVLFESLRKHLS